MRNRSGSMDFWDEDRIYRVQSLEVLTPGEGLCILCS